MEISRELFRDTLAQLMLGVTNKPGQYSPDSIMSDGAFLYSFNDVVGVKLAFPALEGMRFSVHADTLFDAVKAMGGDTLKAVLKDNQLFITCGSSKVKLKVIEDRVKGRYEEAAPWDVEWRKLPPDFADVLPLVLARSTARFSGVYMGAEYMVNADNRFAIRSVVNGALEPTWLAQPTAEIVRKFGEVKEIAMRASWVHFKNGENVLSVRKLIEANYPLKDIMRLFVMPKWRAEGIIPKGLRDLVHKMGDFAEEQTDGSMVLKVTIDRGFLQIVGSRNGVEYESMVETRTAIDDPVSFTCDFAALHKCLRLIPTPAFRLGTTSCC